MRTLRVRVNSCSVHPSLKTGDQSTSRTIRFAFGSTVRRSRKGGVTLLWAIHARPCNGSRANCEPSGLGSGRARLCSPGPAWSRLRSRLVKHSAPILATSGLWGRAPALEPADAGVPLPEDRPRIRRRLVYIILIIRNLPIGSLRQRTAVAGDSATLSGYAQRASRQVPRGPRSARSPWR